MSYVERLDDESDEYVQRYELRVGSTKGRMTVTVLAILYEEPTEDADAAWRVIADVVAEQMKAL